MNRGWCYTDDWLKVSCAQFVHRIAVIVDSIRALVCLSLGGLRKAQHRACHDFNARRRSFRPQVFLLREDFWKPDGVPKLISSTWTNYVIEIGLTRFHWHWVDSMDLHKYSAMPIGIERTEGPMQKGYRKGSCHRRLEDSTVTAGKILLGW